MEKTIEFQGVVYALVSGGKYYLSQSNTNQGRKRPKGLHVAIWEYYSGKKVPKGFCIHHKDGNTFNNDYSNLECIAVKDHIRIHQKQRNENPEYRKRNLESLSKAQEKAKEWHKSEEGRLWHKKHSEEIDWTKRHECICAYCGKTFLSAHKNGKFCSESCGENFRRKMVLSYHGVCKYCGKEFTYGKGKKSQKDREFCSRSCAASFSNIHRAIKVR